MAKKSTAARQTNAARRSQTASKAPEVMLVRQPRPGSEDVTAAKEAPSGSVPVAKPVKSAVVPSAAPKRAPEVTRPSAAPVAARPQSKPTESVSRSTARAQINRAARNQSAQRARLSSQLSPQHYAYVKNDLRLIGILAGSMFLVIILLHFLLPIWLPQ